MNERTKKAVELLKANGFEVVDKFVCFTANACDNSNPKRPGAAAYEVLYPDTEILYRGEKPATYKRFGMTNNRMELIAIICAIGHLPEDSEATVYSSSQPCIKSCQNKCGENQDLLNILSKYEKRLSKVNYEWIKSGSDKHNEECRKAAKQAYADLCRENGMQPNYFVMNGYLKR